MPYNAKQYDAAFDFVKTGDTNITHPDDQRRVQTYDLYENIYINATKNLKLVLRGSEQSPMLVPSGRTIVQTIDRFLGVNFDYLVEGQGDAGIQKLLDAYWKDLFKREALKTKFDSSKFWGLIRGDAAWMVYGNDNKDPGERISIAEIDPRQLFAIESPTYALIGYYIVDTIQDFRDPGDTSKFVARRRSFKKPVDDEGEPIAGPITTDLTYWTIGKWDDRYPNPTLEQVPGGNLEQPPTQLPDPITQLPIYKWNNDPMQNTTWGTSSLAGFETLMYGINQSLTDEDATIVFQGLGMYMTNAAPPIDPTTGNPTDWNIGPMQIIEIGENQTFTRVSGVTDVKPYQDHMDWINEKAIQQAGGLPDIAVGTVDVQTAESGISLKLQLLPLLSANIKRELILLTIMDQFCHDVTTMWLPAYEHESFGNAEAMSQMSVVGIFDDPMPVDRDAEIQEVILLQTSNLILTSMAVAKLRSLGWKYPAVDKNGNALDDDAIAQMLLDQQTSAANAADPFAAESSNLGAFDSATGTQPAPGNIGNTVPNSRSVPLSGS